MFTFEESCCRRDRAACCLHRVEGGTATRDRQWSLLHTGLRSPSREWTRRAQEEEEEEVGGLLVHPVTELLQDVGGGPAPSTLPRGFGQVDGCQVRISAASTAPGTRLTPGATRRLWQDVLGNTGCVLAPSRPLTGGRRLYCCLLCRLHAGGWLWLEQPSDVAGRLQRTRCSPRVRWCPPYSLGKSRWGVQVSDGWQVFEVVKSVHLGGV